MNGFEITNGIPTVAGRPFTSAVEVNDNLDHAHWPWVGFRLRVDTGWEIGCLWRRHGAGPGEPDGATANVYASAGDWMGSGFATHWLDGKDRADPAWFLALVERASACSPSDEHLTAFGRRTA